ncbi:MAG: ABC transporter permease [Rhodothermales bacterium]
MPHSPHPPRLAAWLLNVLLPDGRHHTPLGDFEEYFHYLGRTQSYAHAHLWYWRQVLTLIPRRIGNDLFWSVIMLQNYLKTAYRNLMRYKGYTAINLLGLTLGIACFLMIYLYVQDERSYDQFHTNGDRIHRLIVDWERADRDRIHNSLTSAPMGPQFAEDASAVEAYVRFLPTDDDMLVQHQSTRTYESDLMFADAAVFDVFTFPLRYGDPQTALAEPHTLVLTESMAERYFGSRNPVGETLRINNTTDYTVTGVMRDVPTNAHFRFDALLSFASLDSPWMESWTSNPYYTYVLLRDGTPPEALDPILAQMVETYASEALARMGVTWTLWLQPLPEIYLNPISNDLSTGSGARYLYILSGVALLILALACINFINLSTARATTRAKEISMRKVIGAHRRQLVAQFLGESLLLTTVALILAAGVVWLAFPLFEGLVGRTVPMQWDLQLVLGCVVVVIIVGVLGGLYPAMVLSGMQPLGLMRSATPSKRRVPLRSVLVVTQFAIAVLLMVSTATVYQQLRYMQTKNLGLEPEQVVAIPTNSAIMDRAETLRDQLTALPAVTATSYTNRKPGTGTFGTVLHRADAPEDAVGLTTKVIRVDEHYAETLGLTVVAGRFFDDGFSTDAEASVLLNAQAVADFGWAAPEEAIGQVVIRNDHRYTVIGVVEDYHFQPLFVRMQPLMLQLAPEYATFLLAKIGTHDVPGTLEQMSAIWSEVAPEWPFVHSFLDADFQSLYAREERLSRIFGTFTLLAMLIACLGLFGLATFAVERRLKEVGVRKVLGATSGSIVALFSKDFAVLVGIAMVVAWPVAYYALDAWLQNYAFRIALSAWVFGLSGLIALLIACLTITVQALRASYANPVQALRYE